jgi:glucose/arabinose dehydrogenase
MRIPWIAAMFVSASLCTLQAQNQSSSSNNSSSTLTGSAAFTDYSQVKPGLMHKITLADLPQPHTTESVDHGPHVVPRPKEAWPQAPPGFKVELYAGGLNNPRLIRTAPNGDVFVAQSDGGTIIVLRGMSSEGKFRQKETFATGLKRPFGIAFYPPGSNPEWVYVGNTDSVVRFPYRSGDLKARGDRQTIVPNLPSGAGFLGGGGHWTRDVAFSADGKKMFVSVGSFSNNDDVDGNSRERNRAVILQYNPDGTAFRVYATGIRNPVGLAIQPGSGELWASVNERDELGDNLPPDYITHVQDGGFYGWPWYYMGGHQDPKHAGKHPELKEKVITPDVLLQPHFASLEMTFYEGKQFPSEYRGNIFASEHGSWNRNKRTGYEVIRVPVKNGKATGEYEDFLTGFVTSDGKVWGRPVGVAVAEDGSLLVSDDGSDSIWRLSYTGK